MRQIPFDCVPEHETPPARTQNDILSLKRGCQFIRQIGSKIG